MTEFERKQDALLRLLCHYLIYIGKATALLEDCSNEKNLLQTWRTRWNKPAAFTWSDTEGLEMHYRIEPPADYLVSSSEDESLGTIDLDLSDFEDAALFTQDSDLVKCTACGAFWSDLDPEGVCYSCRLTTQDGEKGLSTFLATGLDLSASDTLSMFNAPALNIAFGDTNEPGVWPHQFSSEETFWDSAQANLAQPTAEEVPGALRSNLRRGVSDIDQQTEVANLRQYMCQFAVAAGSASDSGKNFRNLTKCWKCTSQRAANGPGHFVCQRCLARPPHASLGLSLEIPGDNSRFGDFTDLAPTSHDSPLLPVLSHSNSDIELHSSFDSNILVSVPSATVTANVVRDALTRKSQCNSRRHTSTGSRSCIGDCTDEDLSKERRLI